MHAEKIFAPDGPLAKALPGFRSRPSQVEFAAHVQQAIEHAQPLIAEAGTGTGKTFAYLAPALLHGGKVIVSTGTKTLQDQLFQKDLPAVRDALGAPVMIALLKGRANYVCKYHLARNLAESTFGERQTVKDLQAIERFAARSDSGDRNECAQVPESSSAWIYATSTRENCLGSQCKQFNECFLMKARKQAIEADVVVVNHHLFFADVMLREEGVSDLLPASNTVIFDEAHHLPDVASQFFGESVSTAQVLELVRDVRAASLTLARDFLPLGDAIPPLELAARDVRLAFAVNGSGPRTGERSQRMDEAQLAELPELQQALVGLNAALAEVEGLLHAIEERDPEFAQLAVRTQTLRQRIGHFQGEAASDSGEAPVVRWAEIFNQSVQLARTPLEVGPLFAKVLEREKRAWIFTSATLSVNGDFEHYKRAMGLADAEAHSWPSPFDFAEHALLYVPEGLPDPNTPGFTDAVIDAALPLIEAAGGRTFVLCTSLRAMNRAHERIATHLEQAGLDVPVLKQGDAGKHELLERFRTHGTAVLVGSQSFWEGVDVKGDALSLVVIDKLPFSPPDDPVFAARLKHLKEHGGNPFFDIQVPEAVITLKQGAGRLIRDEQDRGVLMICDPRLVDKPYGKRIWRALPPMKRTRKSEEAIAFLKTITEGVPATEPA